MKIHRRARRLVLVAAASIALVGPLTVPLAAVPEAAASRVGTVLHHYRLPAAVEAARAACRADERARIDGEFDPDMPGESKAYAAWRAANPTAATAWAAAVRACMRGHTQPGGLWNWDALIYVGSETIE